MYMSECKIPRDAKILILGAGCAGLTAASYLQREGYANITILEKNAEVGGKCKTIHLGNLAGLGSAAYPDVYDMGAIELVDSNSHIMAFLNDPAVNPEKIKPVPMPKNYLLEPGNGRRENWKKESFLVPKKNTDRLKLALEITKYFALFATNIPFTQRVGFRKLPPRLCITFSQWCERKRIKHLQDILLFFITLYGYGYMDGKDRSGDIPLPYVMRYLNLLELPRKLVAHGFIDERHLLLALRMAGIDRDTCNNILLPSLKRIAAPMGFGGLMKGIAGAITARDGVIRTGISVESIVLPKQSSDKLEIRYRDSATEYSEAFDAMIVTVTPTTEHLSKLHFDSAPRIFDYFDDVKTRFYCTCLVKLSHLDDNHGYGVALRHIPGKGNPVSNRHPKSGFPFQIFIPPCRADGMDNPPIGIVYIYSDVEITKEQLLQNVVSGINALGGSPISESDILHTEMWPYFPHVDAGAMKNKFYDNVEKLQGDRKCYWAGGLFNFELTERTAAYSEYLVRKHFVGNV